MICVFCGCLIDSYENEGDELNPACSDCIDDVVSLDSELPDDIGDYEESDDDDYFYDDEDD